MKREREEVLVQVTVGSKGEVIYLAGKDKLDNFIRQGWRVIKYDTLNVSRNVFTNAFLLEKDEPDREFKPKYFESDA